MVSAASLVKGAWIFFLLELLCVIFFVFFSSCVWVQCREVDGVARRQEMQEVGRFCEPIAPGVAPLSTTLLPWLCLPLLFLFVLCCIIRCSFCFLWYAVFHFCHYPVLAPLP